MGDARQSLSPGPSRLVTRLPSPWEADLRACWCTLQGATEEPNPRGSDFPGESEIRLEGCCHVHSPTSLWTHFRPTDLQSE